MDKEFFVRAIESNSEKMYRVSYTLLQNNDDCRDALQEAALKAWEKRHTLRNPDFFATWIIRILINECRNIQRKRRRTVSLGEVQEPSVPPPDPTLALALRTLPEKLRLPLMLQYSEGMRYSEIAKALKITEPTVRGRIHRAKEQLRKELEVK